MIGREKAVGGKWYAFDSEGYMYEETFFDAMRRDEPGVRYAAKNGSLASGWLLLNEDGSIHTHAEDTGYYPECTGSWYYFEEDTDPKAVEDTDEKAGTVTVMAVDKEITDKNGVFRVDADGRMLSGEWYEDGENSYYFQHDGNMVKDKVRLIDGRWVSFDETGAAEFLPEEEAPHHLMVEDIVAIGDEGALLATDSDAREIEKEAAIGEKLELNFQVLLASNSNAVKQDFGKGRYDIWTEQDGIGRASVGQATSDGVVTVEFEVKDTEPCSVFLVADGITSLSCFTITGKQGDSVETILPTDSNAEIDGDTAVIWKDHLQEAYENEEITEDVKESFIGQQDILKKTEAVYAEELGIETVTTVTDGAKALFGNGEQGETSAIGLALNAEAKQNVELMIDAAEDAGVDEESYETVAAFDIKLTINGEEKTKLDVPVIITMKLPAGISGTDTTKLFHIHDGGEPEDITTQVTFEDGKAVIVANKFSTYIFTEDKTGTDDPSDKPTDPGTDDPSDKPIDPGTDDPSDKPTDPGTDDPSDEPAVPGTPITEADKAAIEAAIGNANNAMTGVVINGGTEASVASGVKFVTEAEMNALKAAIDTANAALENAETTEEANAALAALNQAIETFQAAVKTGTRTSSGSGSSSGSGGRSGKGRSPQPTGQWILNEIGWWYRNTDGTYPAASWQQLDCGVSRDWYRFDQNGYMCTGWFTDADGAVYYLNPISDGRMGAMLTGWQQIDGQWYYFNTVSNGHLGALLKNTTTPDGYQVNGQGQWIQ